MENKHQRISVTMQQSPESSELSAGNTFASTSAAKFKATNVKDCPYYKEGDEFGISGYALYLPFKKGKRFSTNINIDLPDTGSPCKTLIAELTKILIKHERANLIADQVISCGQCQGAITLNHENHAGVELVEDFKQYNEDLSALCSLLKNFSIFETLDESDLKEFVTLFRLKKYDSGTCMIRRGEPGKNLYIIVSGIVEVLADGGTRIAKLKDGEVFGEMSLISGAPAGASVLVAESTTVLHIKGQDFLQALKHYPTLQSYFAKLISRRLSYSSDMAFIESYSKTSGKIENISSLKLVQSYNYSRKTGVLNLEFRKGTGSLIFREGKIVGAEYNQMKGKPAFFAILAEKEGKFTFDPDLSAYQMLLPEIGMFMELLFEGLRILRSNELEATGSNGESISGYKFTAPHQTVNCLSHAQQDLN